MSLILLQLSMVPLLHMSDFTYKSEPVEVDAGLYAGQLVCAPVNEFVMSYSIPVKEFLVDGQVAELLLQKSGAFCWYIK